MVHIVHAAPALAEEVLQWMDNVHCQLDVALNLYVTGHSLGAAAVSIAYGWYFLEQVILRFQPPVIFESPGVPNRCWNQLREHAAARHKEEAFEAMRSQVIEILGAPNPINMLHDHFGHLHYRAILSHGQEITLKHNIKCIVGSATRGAPFCGDGSYSGGCCSRGCCSRGCRGC
mmetsp:Transcript_93918/g.162595  ORF Transcript_93918/g.162595 Transcript_93918/m.162595 type:complete len:174 (+) Transcript_93918:365-886(+)